MQRNLCVVVLLLTFIIGCSTNDSPVSVNIEQSGTELFKLPSVKKDNLTSTQLIISKEINGNQGGEVPFEFTLSSGILIKGILTVPEKAFNSKETITIIFDDEYATADFYPSPFQFTKPLLLTYSYEGINLSEMDANNLNFYYIADTGRSELVNSKSIIISNSGKQLGIVKAELEHFSRYGWKK